ncbi:ABC transporter substrate-binding protein [Actinoallomurus rhizosphaericola]|uniref:ABC transporter substrate-binding protein n=1 Tax=Actinoallomurus rhizosphaericola TaxID=2952536 RepID=UPI0020930365|nr:ABC transporter substrate-binding protein [Actinoallomurus rhizosphaericola]MCO5998864.1 ABC transporter substrate-binding protein [Actinoallomurus rhizosphaericola]
MTRARSRLLGRTAGTRLMAMATTLALGAVAACSGGGSGSSHGATIFWHGYTGQEAKEIAALGQEWNQAHPGQKVNVTFAGSNDDALKKTLGAFVSGKAPGVAYEFGSSITTLAKRPQTQDLTSLVKSAPEFKWDDFFPAARQAATTPDGKVYGVPALVDNLALVYNKKMFDAAGLSYPTPSWTWTDFQNAARRLTDAGKKQYGWAYVNDGTEDTVWRFLALLWQAGGDLLTPDGKKAAFDSPAGLAAMQLLHDMSVTDHSVYLDGGDQQYLNLFNSGKIGMMWTGPWDLSSITKDVPYGVQILPGKVTHATIAGPDVYMLFNKSDRATAWAFLQWLTSPEVHLRFATATGDLPLRQSETQLPGYQQFLKKYPGDKVFVDNLAKNATKSRPNIPEYSKISQALGLAVQAVLLGKAQPQAALDQARDEVNSVMAGA